MEEEIKTLEDFIDAVGEEYGVVREKQALENLIKEFKKINYIGLWKSARRRKSNDNKFRENIARDQDNDGFIGGSKSYVNWFIYSCKRNIRSFGWHDFLDNNN